MTVPYHGAAQAGAEPMPVINYQRQEPEAPVPCAECGYADKTPGHHALGCGVGIAEVATRIARLHRRGREDGEPRAEFGPGEECERTAVLYEEAGMRRLAAHWRSVAEEVRHQVGRAAG